MDKFIEYMKGKKTYFLVLCGIVFTLLHAKGVIDTATWQTLLGILGFGSVATLRSAVK